jgi:hypothetical protein
MTHFDQALMLQVKVLNAVSREKYETQETCHAALAFAEARDLTIEHYDRLKRLFYLSDGEAYSVFAIHKYSQENPLQENL